MKKLILCAALSLAAAGVQAQSGSINRDGCATVTSPEEIAAIYDFVQHNPAAYAKPAEGVVDTIPVTIHIVGKNDGTGYYKLDNLFSVMCAMNEHYAPANMYYAIKWPIRYINNSSYYEHTSGWEMMSTNKVANTMNVFFVKDPSGACGYYMNGVDCIAIGTNCADPESTTLVHEAGHYFTLPHTFYGWEGGDPPPVLFQEKVTRGSGANCNSAGDGFCDTEADFQAERWNCPYTGTMLDQTGTPYRPDSSLYMGYATDDCMDHFSPMQIARMQDNLHNAPSRAGLHGPFTTWSELSPTAINYPGATMYASNKTVSWTSVPGAEYYYVRITLTTLPSLIRQEAVVAGTELDVTFPMFEGSAYTVNVTPMSSVNVCREHYTSQNFIYSTAADPTGVNDVANGAAGMVISPNPLQGNNLNILLSAVPAGSYEVVLTNINGQRITGETLQHNGGSRTLSLQTEALPAGLYFVSCSGNGVRFTEKLVVQ